jgi:hypothetical protein
VPLVPRCRSQKGIAVEGNPRAKNTKLFLSANTEHYTLKMKLHPSLLLNKYNHSFQTKPQGTVGESYAVRFQFGF